MVQVMCAVLDHSKAQGIDKLVLICLANYCNEKRECYPSIKTLARNAGINDRTVQRSIDRLIELGELTKVADGGMVNGRRWSNTYRVADLHPPVAQSHPTGGVESPLTGGAAPDQPLISSTSHTNGNTGRPKDEEEVASFVTSLGLTRNDASAIYNSWVANGFRTKAGPIRDWKACCRTWKANRWFPSQKHSYTNGNDSTVMVRDSLGRLVRRDGQFGKLVTQ